MKEEVDRQSEEIYSDHKQRIYHQTDRMFAVLMAVQAGCIVAVWSYTADMDREKHEIHLTCGPPSSLRISAFSDFLAFFTGPTLTVHDRVGQMLRAGIHLWRTHCDAFSRFGSRICPFTAMGRDRTATLARGRSCSRSFSPQRSWVLTPDNGGGSAEEWVMSTDIFCHFVLRSQNEMR